MTTINEVRTEIEKIDHEIIELIHRRVGLAEKVLESKQKEGMQINDRGQNHVVLDRAVYAATEKNLDTSSIKEIFEILIRMNIERQHELSGEGNLP
ncbi:chorismate mutase [Methanolobus halotolerans]|uniref:Chorismate mutase n=1 Tax=Methanolobus halotolerans TaxID=2052935 RepID=A0A4E0PVW4_9EURY|nr:chorismate mutase [Methanolobus halotolerans]TGC08372.1 chorismate mutase [Methanolobus halotolerans]